MSAVMLILEILIIILSLVIIVAVALQKSKSEGITGVTATSESDNYFGKGKELGNDEKLAKITKICVVIFVVLSIALTVLFAANDVANDKKAASQDGGTPIVTPAA